MRPEAACEEELQGVVGGAKLVAMVIAPAIGPDGQDVWGHARQDAAADVELTLPKMSR